MIAAAPPRERSFGQGPGATEPPLDPAGASLDLIRGKRLRRAVKAADGLLSSQECDVDDGDLVVAKLQVAHRATVVLRGLRRAANAHAGRHAAVRPGGESHRM